MIFLLARFFPKIISRNIPDRLPSVSIIIAAYNEEKIIKEKLQNTCTLDYPKDLLEIMVVSDGSTDRTDHIVQEFQPQGVQLIRVEGRKGKTECQNQAVKRATGEIIIFSDANSIYDPMSVRYIVENFSDPTVGVVCGELRYQEEGKTNEGVYWKMERKLKEYESTFLSCLGANGAMYALRRSEYVPLPADTMSDFIEPFMVYRNGYRSIYDERAFCVEEKINYHDEFKRKQRVVLRALQSLYIIGEFLNPFRYGWYSIMLWSHKLLRWFGFLFFIILFMSSFYFIETFLGKVIIVLQVIFYLGALFGKKSNYPLLRLMNGFLQVYISAFFAVMYWVLDRKILIWENHRK